MQKGSSGAAAVISALRFAPESGSALMRLTADEWDALLRFGDKTQLILPLHQRLGGMFPPDIREAVDRRAAGQRQRTELLKSTYRAIDDKLQRAGIPYAVLKGFTHCPGFIRDLDNRAQYDIDLYSPEAYRDVYEALRQLGYEPIQGLDRFPLDHLPTLVRKTGWEWRGDFFDPALPLSLEVHYRLWDSETERLYPKRLDEFWERKVVRNEHGLIFTSLNAADLPGYAALHLLRHVLRGDLKPLHLYELASFLHSHADNVSLWQIWKHQHDASLRALESLSFAIAERVFACKLPDAALQEIVDLPRPVLRWLEVYGDSPIRSQFHPNKHELLLHMSLLETAADRRIVFMRRMLPLRMPGPVDAVHIPEARLTWRIQIRKRWRYWLFVSSRALRHVRLIAPMIAAAVSWSLSTRGISAQFLRFLAAAAVFELGMFVFHLLYSLYLLDLGFAEDFLGANAGAMQTGGIAGAIPAGAAAARWGLSRVLAWSIAALGLVSALRVIVTTAAPLLLFAFAAGMLASCWMVCIAPVIAELSPEKHRPLLFSLFFSTGIGVGVLGGILGGELPGISSAFGTPAAYAKPVSLLAGCALMGAGAMMLSRLRLESRRSEETRLYPRNPQLWRFLLIVAMFSLGTGAFNPLYAAFLASVGNLSVESIGRVFALSQLAQVIAILLGGAAVKKFGFRGTISWSFAATAVALVCLGFGPVGLTAAGAYVAYMSFQYMSEPGMFSILMSIASPAEQKGAATLNYLAINGTQAVAALIAGAAVTKLGYGPVLGAAAAVVLLAAFLFPVLTRRAANSIAAITSAQ
jgi:predicted MFS family arabinose efflux permease